MQAPSAAIVLILCFGVVSATPTSTSDNNLENGLDSLPTDALRNIASRIPVVDRYRFSFASRLLRNAMDLNDIELVAARLFLRFGKEKRFVAALQIEDAPPGYVVAIVEELLRSTVLDDSQAEPNALHKLRVLHVLNVADAVGHCDLVKVLYDDINGYSEHNEVFPGHLFEISCDNAAQLASLPLEDLLHMHAVSKSMFLQVLDIKYYNSDYGSFFKDPAWYSQYYSKTVLSHALHLYNKLNGTTDFEPVPFGHIAFTQTMSEQTRMTLHDMYSSSNDISDNRRHFSNFLLQSVLSPGSEMEFFSMSNPVFRTDFLMLACETGRLDWVCLVRILLSCCCADNSAYCMAGQVHDKI